MAATLFSRVNPDQGSTLLDIAADAIEQRLSGRGTVQPPDLADLPTPLALAGASFVSLHTAAGLRGCCGSLEPTRALAHDVWRNAQASAFADPRFLPLAPDEWSGVTELEIAVLSGFDRLCVRSENELLQRLVPGV
ncbi:MAG TPA: AMMECR1 domain-containing protein, partial [Steroidobacteraceae bacterium]